MRRIVSLGLFAFITTIIAGCGGELQDNRVLNSQLPGLYEGIPVAQPTVVASPVIAPEFDLIHITSTGEARGRLETEAGDLLLSGKLNGEFDPDGKLTNATGEFDVWFVEADDAPMAPGPHATAEVLSASLTRVTEDGEIVLKTLMFELDFDPVESQQSSLPDEGFHAFDGDYAVEASNSELRIYNQAADYARTWGAWKHPAFEDIELLEDSIQLFILEASEAGEAAGAVAYDDEYYADWCDWDTFATAAAGDLFIDPYDQLEGKPVIRNTYLLQGTADCFDGVGVMEIDAFGFVSEDDNDVGDERLRLFAELVLATEGEEDVRLMADWIVFVDKGAAQLGLDSATVYVPFDVAETGNIEFDLWYEGEDVPGGFDVEVRFFSAGFEDEACEDILDLSPVTVSCPATADDCDPVLVPYDYAGGNEIFGCSFDVYADALPGFVSGANNTGELIIDD